METGSGTHEGEGTPASEAGPLSERRLEGRALGQHWPISADQRAEVYRRLTAIINPRAEAAPAAPLRYVVQAAQTLIAVDKLDTERDPGARPAAAPTDPTIEVARRLAATARRRRGRGAACRELRTLKDEVRLGISPQGPPRVPDLTPQPTPPPTPEK